ncbi:MAG: DNA replication/repair protein RecF [Bacteroidales bacterium]
MYIKQLSLTNFKNYDSAFLKFSPGINCLVGNNGVGKTNILDAIHYLSLTKSFYNIVDSANIKHSQEYFIIEGVVSVNGNEDILFCSFHRQKMKIFKRNGKEYNKLNEHVGKFPVVMVSPADSILITGGSEERRKFLNKIISQYDAIYLDAILNYNKALQQRNKLLKDFSGKISVDREMLEVWDAQLIRYGEYIYRERARLVKELIPVFNEYYSFISGGNETVNLNYRSQLSESDFGDLLEKSLNKDLVLEYTTAGIHKDDLIFEMGGYPVKSTGSQGQQKSYLVALKLAKFDYVRRRVGFAPVMLLDDLFDKFDIERVEKIIKLVGNHRFGQIFITDTDEERMKSILSRLNVDHRLFRIEKSGNIEVISDFNNYSNETQ